MAKLYISSNVNEDDHNKTTTYDNYDGTSRRNDAYDDFEYAADELPLPQIHTGPAIINIEATTRGHEKSRSSSSRKSNGSKREVSLTMTDVELPQIQSNASPPRSQLNIFARTYFLSNVEQLEIQQVPDLSALVGTSTIIGSQYRVKVPRVEETMFLAVEDSAMYQRTLFKSSRSLTLNIYDSTGETAFVIKKNFSWGWIPGFLHKLTVESSDSIGSIEQNFTITGYSFTVYNEKRKPLCYIYGPTLYSCCVAREAQFQIISVDKSRPVASLAQQWDRLSLDYTLVLTFAPDTNAKLKGLLLGACFLLEFLYFEHLPRRSAT